MVCQHSYSHARIAYNNFLKGGTPHQLGMNLDFVFGVGQQNSIICINSE